MQLLGRRFGKLVVIAKAGGTQWRCRCDCGNICDKESNYLNAGRINSCIMCRKSGGKITHGHTVNGLSPTYTSWYAMLQRCNNPKNKRYENYGGRGIIVCERWKLFANFLEDMGERPKGLTLDRKDVNGNYEKSNCQWANDLAQRHNQRRDHLAVSV